MLTTTQPQPWISGPFLHDQWCFWDCRKVRSNTHIQRIGNNIPHYLCMRLSSLPLPRSNNELFKCTSSSWQIFRKKDKRNKSRSLTCTDFRMRPISPAWWELMSIMKSAGTPQKNYKLFEMSVELNGIGTETIPHKLQREWQRSIIFER